MAVLAYMDTCIYIPKRYKETYQIHGSMALCEFIYSKKAAEYIVLPWYT